MTITQYGEPEIELTSNGPSDLVQWAREASDVHRVAQILSTTQFVPKVLQGRPDDIAATILYGRELNMSPMVSLQQINMIEGRPSLSALSMRGMAQAAGVKFRYEEQTETRCRISALGVGDGQWTTVTWTLDQAKKLGLATKSNWTKQPGAMLIARATSQLCRLVAAPLFLGMSYSTEELRDGGNDLEPTNVESQPAPPAEATRTIKRAPVRATATISEPKPTKPEEPPKLASSGPVSTPETKRKGYVASIGSYSEDDVPQRPLGEIVDRPNMVGANTRSALMAAFNGVGITDRTTRLSYVSDLLKREIGSVNQITEDEARLILDQIKIDYHPNRAALQPEELKAADEWGDVEVVKVPADE